MSDVSTPMEQLFTRTRVVFSATGLPLNRLCLYMFSHPINFAFPHRIPKTYVEGDYFGVNLNIHATIFFFFFFEAGDQA